MSFDVCADCGGSNAATLAFACGAVIIGFAAGAAIGLVLASSKHVSKALFITVGLLASFALIVVLYRFPSSPAFFLPLAFLAGEALVCNRLWREV
jgi:hypothetical protein